MGRKLLIIFTLAISTGCSSIGIPKSLNPLINGMAAIVASMDRYAPIIDAAAGAPNQTPADLHAVAVRTACRMLPGQPFRAVLRRAYSGLSYGVLAGRINPSGLAGHDPQHVYASAGAAARAADLTGYQPLSIVLADAVGFAKELLDLSGSGFDVKDLVDNSYGAQLPWAHSPQGCEGNNV